MIRIFKKYLKSFSLLCAIIAPLMMLLEVFMDLQQPTLMSDIVDVGVKTGNIHYVLMTGGKMALFAVIGYIGGASCCALSAYAAMTMSGRLRQGLFDKIQTLSFAEIDKLKTSSLITRLTNDVTQVQNMLMMVLRIAVRAPFLCIGGIIMSFILSPRLAVIFAVILPIIFCCIFLVMKKSVPLFTKVQRWLDRVNTVMRENLLGVRVVKTFNMEDKQLKRFNDVNLELTEQSIRAQNMTFLLMPAVTFVMNMSVVAVLWFGGNMVVIGGFETGKIMAFINYLVQITNSMMMVVNLIVNISRAQASGERINEVLEEEASIVEASAPVKPENYDIEFNKVSFRYGTGGDYVLKDLSFKIRQGQKVGIIGATGSGKSSLVALIPRLYDATSGQILIGGQDIQQLSLAELRGNIGIVLQESVLFQGTIEDNLRFGREDASEDEMTSSLEDAQAAPFVLSLPDGVNSPVEQRGKNFSGGQKQRLSIARTLLKKPKVLILDDSTSAVDLATEAKLQSAVSKSMRGSTVITIAQRISGVMDCDMILVLEHGRVSAVGSHNELLQSSEIYRNIAVSQLGEEVLLNAAG